MSGDGGAVKKGQQANSKLDTAAPYESRISEGLNRVGECKMYKGNRRRILSVAKKTCSLTNLLWPDSTP
jgi:hypothetical protein